jgi:transcriptional regulator with XRE-family HTH domain
MTPTDPQPICEDVLDAFSVEPDIGCDTLERYLRDFPQYTTELIDLSFELSKEVCGEEIPLSSETYALIGRLWQQHLAPTAQDILDPFAALSVEQQRDLARQLNLPRQVISAFRQRRVKPQSISASFLKRLGEVLDCSVEVVTTVLGQSPQAITAQSFKSDNRPESVSQVSFEQILIDAGVPPEQRELLTVPEE